MLVFYMIACLVNIRKSEELFEESREESLLEAREEEVVLGSEVVGKFQGLQFWPKVKAQGHPKRSQRQLCSFNRSTADREVSGALYQGRKRKATSAVQGPKKRQLSSLRLRD